MVDSYMAAELIICSLTVLIAFVASTVFKSLTVDLLLLLLLLSLD